jgi:hypothetical protein
MTILVRVQISFLVSTMSIRQLEELNVVEGSTCSIISFHMEVNISCNGIKSVTNCIMGACALIAVSAT